METKSEGRICRFCKRLAIHEITVAFSTEKSQCMHCKTLDFIPIGGTAVENAHWKAVMSPGASQPHP